jgi:ectoine hydroxylase-related dioxygenase (phytanoyl-CoA dioxygenase family)
MEPSTPPDRSDRDLFAGDHPVPDEKVSFFQANGYVRFDDVLGDEELDRLRSGVEAARSDRKSRSRDLAGDGDGAERILQMINLWEHHPEVRDYVLGGRIARMAKRLTGSSTIHLYHDQALVKEPGPSAPSPWHQDQPYWPSKEPGMISCWMALDDVTVERGCMQFIPGSHRWGEFPPISFSGGPELKSYLSDEQKEHWDPVPVELEAGSCTFHHGLTFHYTNANTTDRVRRALVTIFIPDGVTYGPDEDMESPFADSITSAVGEPLRGERFPKLA